MSKSQTIDHNATPLDDGSGLRGGTQGGGSTADLMPTNAMPSNPMSGVSSGADAVPEGADIPPSGQVRDPEDITDAMNRAAGDSTRRPSGNATKVAARDAADVPPELSHSGIDEGNKANQARTDTSSGNHASTSGRKLFDAPEDEDDPK
jgi:hypothetical protein